jgi:hypothetical protein
MMDLIPKNKRKGAGDVLCELLGGLCGRIGLPALGRCQPVEKEAKKEKLPV